MEARVVVGNYQLYLYLSMQRSYYVFFVYDHYFCRGSLIFDSFGGKIERVEQLALFLGRRQS